MIINGKWLSEPEIITLISQLTADKKRLEKQLEQTAHRGTWKQIAPQSALCSQCGGALKSNGIDNTGKAYIFNAVYKYCPFCGADMRGTDDVQQI